MKDNEIIDFVIPWVDGADPVWQAEREARAKQIGKEENCDNRNERYRDWDNLKYWFRGVEKFAPWVHKIYFVTWGCVPEWLNTQHPKLQVIYHSDFIPEKYLPTFNANSIELNFHRIPGLAENFVYFNDDMFLLNPILPDLFFRDGKPTDMLALQPVVANADDTVMPYIYLNDSMVLAKYFDKRANMKRQPGAYWHIGYPFLYFVYNFLELFFPKFTGFYTVHGPSPLRCETYRMIWEKEASLLDEVCSHPFRNAKDVNQYLLREWQKLEGSFIPKNVARPCCYYNIGASNGKLIDTIRKRKAKMICINDNMGSFDFDLVKSEINCAFESILPGKSKFEKE